MKTRTKIHFIINPISGKGKNTIDEQLLNTVFSNIEYDVIAKISTQKKEAKKLAYESVLEGADIVVACGGDGTINEVASTLVDTSVCLGVIRLGSGNGLASNLNIPKSINKSLLVIKDFYTTKIDVGVLNNLYFFSNASVGFGAQLIHHYSQTKRRQFFSYVLAFIKAFFSSRKTTPVTIDYNNIRKNLNLFVLFVSNSNEMGYNLTLTPEASLQDGKLDLLYIENTNVLRKIGLALLMFCKKINRSTLVHYHTIETLSIENKQTASTRVQVDGESELLHTNHLSVSIKKAALNVIVPRS